VVLVVFEWIIVFAMIVVFILGFEQFVGRFDLVIPRQSLQALSQL